MKKLDEVMDCLFTMLVDHIGLVVKTNETDRFFNWLTTAITVYSGTHIGNLRLIGT